MAADRRSGVDALLTRLHALRATLAANPADPQAHDGLASALTSKVNLVVARAADVAREAKLGTLAGELTRAFARFLDARADADKGCSAKVALATALADLDVDATAEFLRGIRVVQMEPVWGGSEDVAGPLRGACAAGLVNCGYRHALTELGDLLMDPQAAARAAAARAVSAWGREEGAPLLRMKALAGDPSPEVIGECLAGVIALRSRDAVEFVGRFLDNRDPAISEAAALALGESRQADALDLLRQRYLHSADAELRRVLLLCVAITRLPQATEFLLGEVAAADSHSAADAVAALAIYKHDLPLAARVREKVDVRKSPAVSQSFAKHFSAA